MTRAAEDDGIVFGFRYRGRPSTPTVGKPQEPQKVEQPEAGGCTHASEEMVGGRRRGVSSACPAHSDVTNIMSSLRESCVPMAASSRPTC